MSQRILVRRPHVSGHGPRSARGRVGRRQQRHEGRGSVVRRPGQDAGAVRRGGTDDIAYDGGLEGYTAISKLGVPVMWFSKALGHGGDLSSAHGGDFTKIDLAWLNWWLKDDETATGKGLLVGASCPYCSNSAWEYKSANVP